MSLEIQAKHPLPHIDNVALRNRVFTHKPSIAGFSKLVTDQDPAMDNSRLALLGDAVITLLGISVLECYRSLSRPGDFAVKKALMITRDRMASWSDGYELPKKLIVPHQETNTIPNSEKAKVQVFQAYVGALYKEHGLVLVEGWFKPVLNDTLNEIDEFQLFAEAGESKDWVNVPPAVKEEPVLPVACPSQSVEPILIAGGSERMGARTGASAIIFLNEKCAQKFKGRQAGWLITKSGPDYSPTFKVTISLPGENDPVGIGSGPTSKLAKQEAATVALGNLGWM